MTDIVGPFIGIVDHEFLVAHLHEIVERPPRVMRDLTIHGIR